ncbi:MAG: hypothetical protein AB7E72_13780 [Lysobacterales bacterium]
MTVPGPRRVRGLLLLLALTMIGWITVDTLGPGHLRQWLSADVGGVESSLSSPEEADRPNAEAASPGRRTRAAEVVLPEAEKEHGTVAARPDSEHKPTITPLSPAEARALVRERRRFIDCQISRTTSLKWEDYREQNEWRWLPAELAEAERQSWRDAIGRLSQDCAPVPEDRELRWQLRRQRDANLQAAAEAGDLLARFRLEPRGERTPETEARVRALLYDMVLSGDSEVIAQIGMADMWLNTIDHDENIAAMLRLPAWQLLACDLGLDCRQGSLIFDQECTQNLAACSAADLSASLRQRYPDAMWDQIQAFRGEWLQRIRSGQIAGLFDPPPDPPPGGP